MKRSGRPRKDTKKEAPKEAPKDPKPTEPKEEPVKEPKEELPKDLPQKEPKEQKELKDSPKKDTSDVFRPSLVKKMIHAGGISKVEPAVLVKLAALGSKFLEGTVNELSSKLENRKAVDETFVKEVLISVTKVNLDQLSLPLSRCPNSPQKPEELSNCLFLSKPAFKQLVRDLMQKKVSYSKNAVDLIQFVVENHLMSIIKNAEVVMTNKGGKTLRVSDLELLRRLKVV